MCVDGHKPGLGLPSPSGGRAEHLDGLPWIGKVVRAIDQENRPLSDSQVTAVVEGAEQPLGVAAVVSGGIVLGDQDIALLARPAT